MGINSAFGSDIDSARGDAWHDADWRVDGNWHDVPDGRHDGWYAAHERSDDGFVHSMVKPGGRRTCASDRSPGSRYLACVSDSGKEPSHSMFLGFCLLVVIDPRSATRRIPEGFVTSETNQGR